MLKAIKMVKDLIKIQEHIAKKVSLKNGFSKIKTIAGFDVAYLGEKAKVCGVVLDYRNLEIKEIVTHKFMAEFPYIPTFLSFREGPPIIEVYKMFKIKPDVLMIDGHGIAHPRKAGLASYIGVLLNKPTIGVAKSRLIGEYKEPKKPFSATKLMLGKNQIGWVLKSGKNYKPIFISPGHKISFRSSLKITMRCIKDEKLPEPIRIADFYANK
jgi:deoxyribonuclease V